MAIVNVSEQHHMGKFIPKILVSTIACLLLFSITPCFSATKYDKKQAQAYRDKGYEAQRAGNLDMALSYYQRAVETDPTFAVVYNDIGVVLEAKGQNDKAYDAYARALSFDSNYLSALYNLAALCEKQNDYEKAQAYWRKRVQLGEWSDVWTWKAKERLEALKTTGHGATSEELGLGLDPKRDAQYYLFQAKAYISEGDYIAAFHELSKAAVLFPGQREIEQLLEETGQRIILSK